MNNIYGKEGYENIQKELHDKLQALRIQYKDDSDSLNQAFIKSDIYRLKAKGWY